MKHKKKLIDPVNAYFHCLSKCRYKNITKARKAAKTVRSRTKGLHVVVPYECKYCGGYHIGHLR